MNYIREIHLDWEKTCRFAFNNCSNPDDDQLGIQIVKVKQHFSLIISLNQSLERIFIEPVVVGRRTNMTVQH